MKTVPSALSPLLRSNAQGDLLAVLFLNPENEYSLSDLARRIGALPATVHREVERLVDSGILRDRMVGRSRLVRMNEGHLLHKPLSELLLLSYGPKVILEQLLEALPGVEQAFIYGSWAARYAGESGQPPQDVDVAVIGSVDRETLSAMAREAERSLHREVNVARITPDDWEKAEAPFVSTLKSRPLVPIAGNVVNE